MRVGLSQGWVSMSYNVDPLDARRDEEEARGPVDPIESVRQVCAQLTARAMVVDLAHLALDGVSVGGGGR